MPDYLYNKDLKDAQKALNNINKFKDYKIKESDIFYIY